MAHFIFERHSFTPHVLGARMEQRMNRRDGFTLIELMIVVVIIGILAAIAIPKFNQVSQSAKEAEAGGVLKQIYALQDRYRQRYDAYADRFQDLEGSADPVGSAKYYDFFIQGTPTTFTVCARPKTGLTIATFQIDQYRSITTLASSAACSGNGL
jgi:type IV pilus assembly protein PilE